MKQGINLSLGRKRVDNLLKKVFYGTVGVFAFTVILAIILISYQLILNGSDSSLTQKTTQLQAQLTTLQLKKDKLMETRSRLSDIKNIIAKRSPVTTRINTVIRIIPSDIQMNSINGTDTDLQVTLESEDLNSINGLIEDKVAQLAADKKRGIKKIEMRSFGLNPKTLKYQVVFGITFS